MARILLTESMMMLRFTITAFLTIVSLSSASHAKVLDIEVKAKKGKVTAWKLNDGYTMLALVKPAIAGLEDAIREEMIPGMRFKVTPIHGGAQELKITLRDPILKYSASFKRGRLRFELDYQTREDNMIQRIKSRLFVPVPSSFVAKRFSAAESLLRRGQIEDALASFKDLSEEYALRSWSQLRLSDIALLSGDTRGACRRYGTVVQAHRVQISGMLAQLRRQVLGCGWREDDKPDWDVMLERADRVRGSIGKFIREEAVWAMNQVATAAEVDLTLQLLDNVAVKQRQMRRQLARGESILVSRAIRLPAEPIDVARMCYRHKERIAKHLESNNLRLLCAKSYLELDLLDKAILEAKALSAKTPRKAQGGQWNKRLGPAQSMIFLARAYRQTGDPDYVYATLVKYQRRFGRYIPDNVDAPEEVARMTLKDLEVGRNVMSLDRRIKGLERAIRADARE